jgi:PAS domain S-box-containing protein
MEKSQASIHLPSSVNSVDHDYKKYPKNNPMDFFDFYQFFPVGLLTLNKKGIIVSANPTASTLLLDGDKNELIGQSLYSFVMHKDQKIFDQHLQRIFKQKTIDSCELRLNSKKGHVRYIRSNSNYACLRKNNHVSRTVFTDITEFKKREAQLLKFTKMIEKVNQEKEEARAVLDAIFDCTPLGMGFWDKDLRFVRLNDALAGIDGLPVKEHIGRRIDEVDLHFSDMDKFMRAWKNIMKTGTPMVNVEVSGMSAAHDNRIRHWVVSWYPVSLDNKNIGIAATMLDITERKGIEEELRKSRGELELCVEGRSRDLELKTLSLEKEIERRIKYGSTPK